MATHPVFLPGKSHEQRSLMWPWDCKELDTAEQLGRWLLQMAELSNVYYMAYKAENIYYLALYRKEFADSCSKKKT